MSSWNGRNSRNVLFQASNRNNLKRSKIPEQQTPEVTEVCDVPRQPLGGGQISQSMSSLVRTSAL